MSNIFAGSREMGCNEQGVRRLNKVALERAKNCSMMHRTFSTTTTASYLANQSRLYVLWTIAKGLANLDFESTLVRGCELTVHSVSPPTLELDAQNANVSTRYDRLVQWIAMEQLACHGKGF